MGTKKGKLNSDEEEIIDDFLGGELEPVEEVEREKERYREYAKSFLQKNKRVNIRISERDLVQLQRRAVEEGLPYQTLMSSILHKYITGKLKAG